MSQAEAGETLYDSDEHILRMQTSMEVAGIGKVRGLTAVILTERGTISIHAYALGAEFDDYTPLFEAIVRNVSIPESIRYKPRMTDSIPISAARLNGRLIARWLGEATVWCLAIAVLFIVLKTLARRGAWLARRWRRNPEEEKDPDETEQLE